MYLMPSQFDQCYTYTGITKPHACLLCNMQFPPYYYHTK